MILLKGKYNTAAVQHLTRLLLFTNRWKKSWKI